MTYEATPARDLYVVDIRCDEHPHSRSVTLSRRAIDYSPVEPRTALKLLQVQAITHHQQLHQAERARRRKSRVRPKCRAS